MLKIAAVWPSFSRVSSAFVPLSRPSSRTSTVTVSEHGGPPFLTGSWQCWYGRYDVVPTSCRHGHVLAATFTATDPDVLIDHMDFAPEGRLGVLDPAGNPLLLESDAD